MNLIISAQKLNDSTASADKKGWWNVDRFDDKTDLNVFLGELKACFPDTKLEVIQPSLN